MKKSIKLYGAVIAMAASLVFASALSGCQNPTNDSSGSSNTGTNSSTNTGTNSGTNNAGNTGTNSGTNNDQSGNTGTNAGTNNNSSSGTGTNTNSEKSTGVNNGTLSVRANLYPETYKDNDWSVSLSYNVQVSWETKNGMVEYTIQRTDDGYIGYDSVFTIQKIDGKYYFINNGVKELVSIENNIQSTFSIVKPFGKATTYDDYYNKKEYYKYSELKFNKFSDN